MQRDRELVDFEIDPTTGKARVIDAASGDLAASAGLARKNRDRVLTALIERRAMSTLRKDKDGVLAAFGAKSLVDLALMGHGLSLSDQFWYRTPGSAERWEDVNFFDNGWDPGFGAAILLGDYARLAACSPDVPEVTTPGHAVKAWERNDGGIYLVKAAERPDGAEHVGAKLAFDLCSRLFRTMEGRELLRQRMGPGLRSGGPYGRLRPLGGLLARRPRGHDTRPCRQSVGAHR